MLLCPVDSSKELNKQKGCFMRNLAIIMLFGFLVLAAFAKFAIPSDREIAKMNADNQKKINIVLQIEK